LIGLQYPVVEELDASDLDALLVALDVAKSDPVVQVEAGGDLFFAFSEPETGVGELIGLVAAVVVLLVAFGSVIAMGLPIAMALFGLALGVSSMALITKLIEIPAWAPEIGAMIGLGVGIDYALFLVTRHREHLDQGMTVVEAAGQAVATAGQAVVFAGGTVVIAILGLGVAGVPFMTAAGVAISVIVFIMVLASVTLLPALLGLAGHRIDRFTVRRVRTGHTTALGSRWERWGRHVTGNAWAYAIGVSAVLLAMTAPVLSLELGFPDDGTMAPSTTQRRAYDLVAEGFGPGINGPLLVAVDLESVPDRTSAEGAVEVDGLLEALGTAIADDPGVVGLIPADVDLDAGVATMAAITSTAPQDVKTVDTIDRLRSTVFPSVLGASDATAHVGGQTATFADVAERISDRLVWFVLAVVVLSFLLLTVLFRSVVVAVKAAVLNLLSIGAAYGVLVMVFQWGWGASLLGLESTVPIVSFIPMFMFAMLFGLSMDYEVFLLSRVREEYAATGDNDGSVIAGIAGTARVITSAALIMVSVFGGFVLSDDPVTKMFGLGLATAIAVDATVVRMILVPATMSLMGSANWWLPAWLDRLLPSIELDAGVGHSDPADAAVEFEPLDQVPV